MSAEQENQKNRRPPYVYPFDPVGLPEWVWGVILGLLFLLFIVGIYYATKGPTPQVSTQQFHATGGIMKTPGAV